MAAGDRGTGVLGFPDGAPRPSRGRRRFLWLFSIAMVVTAGTAFVFKLIEFFHTATRGGPDAMGSFLIPVLNYLLVAGGFACLFLWAYLTGQFRDVEGPKYRMLQMQEQFDRAQRKQG
jgi:cbb3-type cytochrome oxidase maturation protein